MSDQRNFPFSSQNVRIVDKSYCFCMLEHPPKRCCSPAGNSSATFSEIVSLPPPHTHTHAHTLSLTENYTIKIKANMYSLCHHECQSTGDLFIYLFLALSHPSASTWLKPVGFLYAHASAASVKRFASEHNMHQWLHFSSQTEAARRQCGKDHLKIYHLSLGLLFIVAYCFSCCSVSILPINLKQLNYF